MFKRFCCSCVNFIYADAYEIDEDVKNIKILCDFDHFPPMTIDKAMLNVPEMFDCLDYESLDIID